MIVGVMVACAGPTPVPMRSETEAVGPDPRQLQDRAWASYRSGDSATALEAFERAAALFAEAGDVEGELEAQTDAAVIVSESGAPDRAVLRLQELVERAEDAGLLERAARSGILLARSLSLAGDHAGAHAALDAAASAEVDTAQAELDALVELGRANTFLGEGRLDDAASAGRRAVEACEAAGLPQDATRARSVVAYALHQLGDDDGAITLYRRLLNDGWRDQNQPLIQFVYCNLADIEWRRSDAAPAEDDLRAALDGFEAARASSPATADERAAFLEMRVPAYDRLIRLLADTYRGPEALEVAERFRARSLLETLRSASPADFSPDERLILAELGGLRLELESASSSRRTTIRREIDRLEAHLASRSAMRRESPAGGIDHPTIDLQSIRDALDDGDGLVAYWVSDERTFAWLLRPSDLTFAEIPLPRSVLERHVQQFLRPLTSRSQAIDAALRGTEREHLAAGRRLYDWLIGPFPEIASVERLIVVPDLPLHDLPFEALMAACEPDEIPDRSAGHLDPPPGTVHSPYSRCRYLGLERSVSYLPSAGTLAALRRRRELDGSEVATGSLLALAPWTGAEPAEPNEESIAFRHVQGRFLPLPLLPKTRREVQSLADFFEHGTSLEGRDASEASFKAQAAGYRVLHLATHGLVDDEVPMASGVLLAPSGADDGLLQGHEVRRLRLHARLVTLSACRSGRGAPSRGEGMLGLSRAFLQAGSSAVLVSLWDVGDETSADLMQAFYRHLSAGASPADALRLARVERFGQVGRERLVFRRRSVSYAHPSYWAAFRLIGLP